MTQGATRAPSYPAVPAHVQEIDARWITHALQAAGAIAPDNAVAAVEWIRLGEGEGFLGELARITLTYERDEAGAPASVIAKFPAKVPQNRALAMMGGYYEREIRFYRNLAATVPVTTPRCFYGDFEPPGRAEAAVTGFLARLPDRVTIRLLDRLLAQAGKSNRRFGLLVEDLGDLRVGDQAAGCSVEDAEIALRALARLHARFWESPLLDQPWIPTSDAGAELVHGIHRRAWPEFEERFRARLTPEVRRVTDWTDANGVQLLRRMGRRPRTLAHGDFRLDNLFFRDGCEPDDERAVTIIDWQVVTAGSGMTDVAFFLRPNLQPEIADATEDHLVELYHRELVAHGVTGYTLEQCREDYVLAQLWVVHRGIILVGMLDFAGERGAQMVDRAVERAMLATPNIDLDAVRL